MLNSGNTAKNLGDWISASTAPSLCIVNNSSNDDFIRAVVLSKCRPIRILADRAVAADVARVANEEFVPVPTVAISRGVTDDLEALLTGADGPPTILPYTLLHGLIQARSKRIAREMDVIAGYPPPAALVLEAVVGDLGALLAAIASRGRSALIVHDLFGVADLDQDPNATYFSDPFAEPEPGSSGGNRAREELRRLSDKGLEDEISLDVVRSHAEFISDSPSSVLERMCPALAKPASARLLHFWREQIKRLAIDEDGEDLAARALKVLDASFGPT